MDYYPIVSLKISVFLNFFSLCFNGISDCDESYNYWEPLYFLITSGKGGGFQTWEYSPQYGLRSYLYLWLFGWPGYITYKLTQSTFLSFLIIRLFLLILSSFSVFCLSYVLNTKFSKLFNNSFLHLSLLVPIFLSFSPGNFISATNLVPSAIVSTLATFFIALWILEKYFFAIGCIAFCSIIVWPFSVVLGIPLAIQMIANKLKAKFFKYTLFFGVIFIIPVLIVDSYYFGLMTLPPLNIILYNVLNSNTGSYLYGTEPISFYFKNYLLNFNILFVILLLIPIFYIANIFSKILTSNNNTTLVSSLQLYYIASFPLLIWLVVFFIQPHKEERFLFPSYPFIALSVGLIVAQSSHVLLKSTRSKLYHKIKLFMHYVIITLVIGIFIVMSVSRLLAIVFGYSAPIFLTRNLPLPPPNGVTFCLGRDWYLFPSRFLLPGPVSSWKVEFLPSNFEGQLPSKYLDVGPNLDIVKSTRKNGGNFNVMNKEEKDRYVLLSTCDYVLDRDSNTGNKEFFFFKDKKNWKSIINRTIIESNTATPLNQYFSSLLLKLNISYDAIPRAFYFPYYFKNRNKWVNLHIFKKTGTLFDQTKY